MKDKAATTRPELEFKSLVVQLLAAVAVMIAVGLPLCNWRLGRWVLAEAALAATAAILPQLMTGRITVAIARRYSMMVAGAFYMDFRLVMLRALMALAMVAVGLQCLEPHAGATLSWFAGIYIVLAALGARWLAGARRMQEKNI